MTTKKASPDHPIHDLIAERWSPYGFDPSRQVPKEEVLALFEAARWAASSYNEQPGRYIVAAHDEEEEFGQMLRCLVEANQAWAKNAAVLILGVVSTKFSRNDKPNKAAVHDLGLAAGNICIEATARGLSVHQMIGIRPEIARKAYGIPEAFEPYTALAIGYAADPSALPDNLRERDTAPRQRRPLAEFVFGVGWEKPAGIVS